MDLVGSPSVERQQPPPPPRSDFAETAFFLPQLLTGADGTVSFQIQMPDSVTEWTAWAHAIADDLRHGSASRNARTAKELMVRPYLPRFLREGDRAELKVVVNNASDRDLSGTLSIDIVDAESGKSLREAFGLPKRDAESRDFAAKAGGSANITFAVKTPAILGQVAVKVTAKSGDFSDGELRPLPVLPGRMHLVESRFAMLKDQGKRELAFADLAKSDDATRAHEQLVVTVDAQLFNSVLAALPYLVKYPYECTEQTLNRFVSTGILASLYGKYPSIARLAKQLGSRKTEFEAWDRPDPNRSMALEETPWLDLARGGGAVEKDLYPVLDPFAVKATRVAALAKLQRAQLPTGAFPWFPGGSSSTGMTLYLLGGFAKATEFGVEVPKEMTARTGRYLHAEYLHDIKADMKKDCCWERVTQLNYVLSSFPDPSWYGNAFTREEREAMLGFSFKHWQEHSPYLKGLLAVTLKRLGRERDARLVWESALDRARTAPDLGTFWPPQEHNWLWYNDDVESQAAAIRTTMAILPGSDKLDGMVEWLLLNKQTGHWKSTRATAEAIYALAGYLKAKGQLSARQQLSVTAGSRHESFDFAADEYRPGKNQMVIIGADITKATTPVVVENLTRGLAFASATWHYATDRLPAEARGDLIGVTREYFRVDKSGREVKLVPLRRGDKVEIGDEIEVHLGLRAKSPMEYVHLRDPRAAGAEPGGNLSRHRWDRGLGWYEEIRDSGTSFFFERLPQGQHVLSYRIRASMAGAFKVAPATAQPMYAPEHAAFSAGHLLEIRAGR